MRLLCRWVETSNTSTNGTGASCVSAPTSPRRRHPIGSHHENAHCFGRYNGQLLEEAVADLEGAAAAVGAASGMAALTETVLALVEACGQAVADEPNAYGGTRSLLEVDLPRLGIITTLVDAADVERALTPRSGLLPVEC